MYIDSYMLIAYLAAAFAAHSLTLSFCLSRLRRNAFKDSGSSAPLRSKIETTVSLDRFHTSRLYKLWGPCGVEACLSGALGVFAQCV